MAKPRRLCSLVPVTQSTLTDKARGGVLMVLITTLLVTFQGREWPHSPGACRGHHPSLVPVELSRVLTRLSPFPCPSPSVPSEFSNKR